MIAILSGDKETERLLSLLLAGEKLAASITSQQARYFQTDQPRIARFLRAQSSQETFHANVFRSALLWFNPKNIFSDHQHRQFSAIEKQLEQAIHKRSLAESVLGLHVIIEALGECCLHDMDTRLQKYRVGLRRLRRMILHQEKAHHAFGERFLARQELDEKQVKHLRNSSCLYLEQVQSLLTDIEPTFQYFDISAKTYMEKITRSVEHSLSCSVHTASV